MDADILWRLLEADAVRGIVLVDCAAHGRSIVTPIVPL